jgi:hypothetical protein
MSTSSRSHFFLVLFACTLGFGCGSEAQEAPDSGAPVVAEETEVALGGVKGNVRFFASKTAEGEVVFPTYAAHLLGQEVDYFAKGAEAPTKATRHLATLTLENTSSTPRKVEFTLRLDGYTAEAKKTLTLAPNAKVVTTVDATLDFNKLSALTTPTQAVYSYELIVDGKTQKANGITVQVLPKESAFLSEPQFEKNFSLLLLAGVMTTPNHPRIQELLNIPGAKFAGYQGVSADAESQKKVAAQAKLIYNAIKARGVNYVSTTESFFSGVQRIRWPSQSIDPKISSANCVDGALLFASALEAIDLEAYVITVPGHAFAGFRLSPPGTPQVDVFIETTMVGSATFEQAAAEGLRKYNTAYVPNKGKDGTMMVPLAVARKMGIKPGAF